MLTRGPKAFVTGKSVVGIKYRDGVMIAADRQASYGSYAKYKDIPRIFEIAPETIMGSSGEYSNVQALVHSIKARVEAEQNLEDGVVVGPSECFEIVRKKMYRSRSKSAPQINFHVIGGLARAKRVNALPFEADDRGRFLGGVNHLGNFFHASVVASGMGAHLAVPLLRSAVEGREDEITREEAAKILENCMRVLFYRDTGASSSVQIAYVDSEGTHIESPHTVSSEWKVGTMLN